MQRLDENCERALPLVKEMEFHLSVQALVAGTMPGIIYVDDQDAPRSALAFNNEGWYLIGNAQNRSFNEWVRTYLCEQALPQARRHGDEDVPLHYHPDGWRESDILEGLKYHNDYQQYFRFVGPLDEVWRDLPPGCVLRSVDAELLSQPERFPISDLISWARGGFGTIEAFLAIGIGMCLEREGQIVSWCMPDCAVGTRCELGIHTVADQRRQGFAAKTVAATVAGCLAKGFTQIGWHCWSANEASAGLARKVGCAKIQDHPAFLLEL